MDVLLAINWIFFPLSGRHNEDPRETPSYGCHAANIELMELATMACHLFRFQGSCTANRIPF